MLKEVDEILEVDRPPLMLVARSEMSLLAAWRVRHVAGVPCLV